MTDTKNPGEIVYALMSAPPGAPYPTYDGDAATAYQFISSAIVTGIDASAGLDLRAMYGNDVEYPPSSMFSVLQKLQCPDSIAQDVWDPVYAQIQQELNWLVSLAQFQTNMGTTGTAVSGVQSQRVLAAQDFLSGSSGSIWILAAFAGLAGLAPVDDLGTVMGFFYSAAASLYGDQDVSGEFARIVAALSDVTANATGTTSNLYSSIGPDWGKLQELRQQMGDYDGTLTADEVRQAGDAYEIVLYQALLPSTMAVVSYEAIDWGECRLPNGSGLGNMPNDHGPNGCNAGLCQRLMAIGASLADLESNQNGWALEHWVCTSTRFGTSCARRG